MSKSGKINNFLVEFLKLVYALCGDDLYQ